MRKRIPPTKALTAAALKNHTGDVLRALQKQQTFLLFRRNKPLAIIQSLEQYVKDHSDEYEDVQDYLDTWMEQHDPEFQRSLRESQAQYRRGDYLTLEEVRMMLRGRGTNAQR